jgi:hypothetical protein
MTQIEILQMIWRGISTLLGPAFKMRISKHLSDDGYAILTIYLDNLGDICRIEINESGLLLTKMNSSMILTSDVKKIDMHDPNQFDPIDIIIDIEKFVEEKRQHRNERDAKWKAQKPAQPPTLRELELKRPEVKQKHHRQRRWHRRR